MSGRGPRQIWRITTGKNAGKPPSVASLYRALADADRADRQDAPG
jgi:hypothetical protein